MLFSIPGIIPRKSFPFKAESAASGRHFPVKRVSPMRHQILFPDAEVNKLSQHPETVSTLPITPTS